LPNEEKWTSGEKKTEIEKERDENGNSCNQRKYYRENNRRKGTKLGDRQGIANQKIQKIRRKSSATHRGTAPSKTLIAQRSAEVGASRHCFRGTLTLTKGQMKRKKKGRTANSQEASKKTIQDTANGNRRT